MSQALERVLDLLGLEGELRKEVFESTMSVTSYKLIEAKRESGVNLGRGDLRITTGVMADDVILSLGGDDRRRHLRRDRGRLSRGI